MPKTKCIRVSEKSHRNAKLKAIKAGVSVKKFVENLIENAK